MSSDNYTKTKIKRASIFCERFPGGIDFVGKTILDMGCGYGHLIFRALERGSKSACGIDIDESRIKFCNNRLSKDYPQFIKLAKFICSDIREIDAQSYDIILSQATFEHIIEPETIFSEMIKRLSINGKIYIGFGPLYKAPWGDHRWTEVPFQSFFPWAHLLFSESWMIKHRNKKYPKEPISSLADLKLNGYSLCEYLKIFQNTNLSLSFVGINRSESFLGPMLNVLRRFPGLQEYLSLNLYCIFERQSV